MQKISPCLWFDSEAEEAAKFYTSIFRNSKIGAISTYPKGTPGPEGSVMTVEFEIEGYELTALNAGPVFRFNPAISFMLNFDPSKDGKAREHLDSLWEKLSDGGKTLMELQEYPFSKRYGWIQDKYGVTWQLILTDPGGEPRPFIIPSLLFVNDESAEANEAIDFYVSVFKDAKRGETAPYPKESGEKEGALMFADFILENQWFAAMDSAREHGHTFDFNEAISLMVLCDTQEEIDDLWGKLSAVPESEQCGWLKDKFGVSWQIAPKEWSKLMGTGEKEKIERSMQAMLQMKKLDIAELQKAYDGK